MSGSEGLVLGDCRDQSFAPVILDVDKLIESRTVVQANSGGATRCARSSSSRTFPDGLSWE